MSRAWALVLLAAAGCGRDPEPTTVQRGTALFAPVSERIGAGIVADLRKREPAAYERSLQELGVKDDAGLARRISDEALLNYEGALSISASKEAELKAGKFADDMNRRKVDAAIQRAAASKQKMQPYLDYVLRKVQSGEWKSGLELEFAARVLEAPPAGK